MKKNMGRMDKTIRIGAAIAIGVLYYADVINGSTAIILGVIAGIFVVTSFISFCPIYLPFGLSTRKNTE